MTVIEYVTEEVRRQGHDVAAPDGWLRVGWMLQGWVHAYSNRKGPPVVDDAILLGKFVEPHKNVGGVRKCDVYVGNNLCPRPERLNFMLVQLFESRDLYTPIEFYKQFEQVHPFEDGNGRTGKILLNWMNNTLDIPVFPPSDLWGRVIENP